mmetsp:Transcript_148338/g.476311  ORF Transcript_148338/g.476311 Transcript_148338/m.476311 type:complete len:217 (+) Transcript_148338:107-757(+)
MALLISAGRTASRRCSARTNCSACSPSATVGPSLRRPPVAASATSGRHRLRGAERRRRRGLRASRPLASSPRTRPTRAERRLCCRPWRGASAGLGIREEALPSRRTSPRSVLLARRRRPLPPRRRTHHGWWPFFTPSLRRRPFARRGRRAQRAGCPAAGSAQIAAASSRAWWASACATSADEVRPSSAAGDEGQSPCNGQYQSGSMRLMRTIPRTT